jgi:hypothetical protein
MLENHHLFDDNGYVNICLKRGSPIVQYGGSIHKSSPSKAQLIKALHLDLDKIVITNIK